MSDRLRTTPGGTPGTFALRLVVAMVLTAVAALLLLTVVLVALGPRDDPSVTFGWVYQAMVVAVAAVCMPRLWRWVAGARPRDITPVLPPEEEPVPGPHEGLSGEVPPPRRW